MRSVRHAPTKIVTHAGKIKLLNTLLIDDFMNSWRHEKVLLRERQDSLSNPLSSFAFEIPLASIQGSRYISTFNTLRKSSKIIHRFFTRRQGISHSPPQNLLSSTVYQPSPERLHRITSTANPVHIIFSYLLLITQPTNQPTYPNPSQTSSTIKQNQQ